MPDRNDFKLLPRLQFHVQALPEEKRRVHEIFACKLDGDGHALAPGRRYEWDSPTDRDRQRVAGATACYLYVKLGVPYILGTYPQPRDKTKPKTSSKIWVRFLKDLLDSSTVRVRGSLRVGEHRVVGVQVGKNKEHGYLRPCALVVPIDIKWVESEIPNLDREAVLTVECHDFIDADTGKPPLADIVMLEYSSQSVEGRVLRWYALPLKYYRLRTINSLQSKGIGRLLIHLDYIWVSPCHPWSLLVYTLSLCLCAPTPMRPLEPPSCPVLQLFHQVFTAVTRALHPPPRIGETVIGLEGCVGIVDLVLSQNDLFDPMHAALGVHPKVAVYLATLQENHKVPHHVLHAAKAWLQLHNAFHLEKETNLISLAKAAQLAERAVPGGATSVYSAF